MQIEFTAKALEDGRVIKSDSILQSHHRTKWIWLKDHEIMRWVRIDSKTLTVKL